MLTILMLTGCEQAPAPNVPDALASVGPAVSSDPIVVPKPVSDSGSPFTNNAPVTSPIKEPVGFETGLPKEEPVVSGTKKQMKQSALKLIYSVGKGNVAITIDDGPTKYTGELLKVLKEQNTHVTFFFIGQNAAAFPQSVTEAVYEGHEVGYHSDTHPHMSKMTYDAQENEFNSGLNKLIKFDKHPVTLFRPPYGAYNNDTKLVTEEHHMQMVLWNEDPKDWATTDPSKVVKSVLAQVQSGSIIVMHDHPSTIAALPDIIKGIRSKGYTLVTVPH
ncbi:polysaccharide deacetylase family protein [Paenibacillus sp. yr247]|uniref:polysaccharide deacetylase family protein n=1 Tax=Paenibacillus sp. yr247 TaxID=1761880 RepID=UPI001586FF87|nr:polysaccharide deacetylase family protein [Paenibacillus sp. yr247]